MARAVVRAWGSAGEDVDARHAERFGRTFRRISRYVKLAQVGAVGCLDGVDRAGLGRVGVFLGTGLGNTADIVPLAEGVLHPDKPWASPMAFAGCVGNAAAFHVARTLDLQGPNVTVSQEEVSFEAALAEALLALDAGLDHALVGGVDVRTGGDEDHRARMNAVGVPGAVTEGAGWVLLARAGVGPRVLDAWVRRAPPSDGGARVLPGWRLDGDDRETRLVPVATALRMVDLLAGREPFDAPVRLLQRTHAGVFGVVELAP
jgi:hypothetical protein